MKLSFNDIIDKECDKSAIVIGHGPSLKRHMDDINKLATSNKIVIVSCNDFDLYFPSTPIHYWVFANNEASIPRMAKRVNAKNTTVVYADSIDLTNRNKVDNLLKVPYLPYDQRHFNGKGCSSKNCCKHIINGRLTIQEEFQKYTKYHNYNKNSDTVAIPMMYISVLLGCKNIYITGVDLDYKNGYVDGKQLSKQQIQQIYNTLPRKLETISAIRDSAKNINVNIYCLDDGMPISDILEKSNLPF